MRKTLREVDSLLALVALANVLQMSVMAAEYYGCEWVCPWYAVGMTGISWPPMSIWTFAPTRLLAAALFLRARRAWTEAIALLLTAQVVVGNLLFTLNPDTFRWDLERGPTFAQTPAVQALLAAAILGVAGRRIARRLCGGKVARPLTLVGAATLGFLVLGYASNFASHRAADREVARFVSEVALKGRSFYALTDTDLGVFCEVGAPVRKGDTSQEPSVLIAPTMFVAPFILEAHWDYYRSPDSSSGSMLVAGFFGSTFVLRRGQRGESPFAWRLLTVFYPG